MASQAQQRRLTDLVAVTHARDTGSPGRKSRLGTRVTRAIETIDNNCESWFLGALPAASRSATVRVQLENVRESSRR